MCGAVSVFGQAVPPLMDRVQRERGRGGEGEGGTREGMAMVGRDQALAFRIVRTRQRVAFLRMYPFPLDTSLIISPDRSLQMSGLPMSPIAQRAWPATNWLVCPRSCLSEFVTSISTSVSSSSKSINPRYPAGVTRVVIVIPGHNLFGHILCSIHRSVSLRPSVT
jgi:hypothetical protein